MGNDERHSYFLGWDLAKVPEGFSFVRELKEANGGVLPVCAAFGIDGACRYAADVGANPNTRRALVLKLRGAYWWVRNARWCDSAERVADAEQVVLAAVQFLELAGVSVLDIVRLAQCHAHKCVCDDCDLIDGEYFDAWRPALH